MASLNNLRVDDRLDLIRAGLKETQNAAKLAPGLVELLDRLVDPAVDVSREDSLRGLLKVYKDSSVDSAYQTIVDDLLPGERERIESFVAGDDAEAVSNGFELAPSTAVREEMQALNECSHAIVSAQGQRFSQSAEVEALPAGSRFGAFLDGLKKFFNATHYDGEVKVWEDVQFQNWGRTVEYQPAYTLWPTTTKGVQAIIHFAKEFNFSVRCSGARHSWAYVFGREGMITISTLDPEKIGSASDHESLKSLWESTPTELESIEAVSDMTPQKAGNTLVRVGTACTNERLRRWCIKEKNLTLPLNANIVEITLGGSNASICHGAGIRNQTLSDLVRAIEYVDAHGQVQKVDDMDQLRAAAGCFGLMGVVTHITLEFEPMTYAELRPAKLPVMQAIPPPPGMPLEKIPSALRISRTEEQKRQDQADFERRCKEDYYAEWQWVPYSDEAWVNTWQNTAEWSDDVVDLPDDASIFIQWAGTVLMNIAQSSKVLETVGKLISVDFTGTTIINRNAMELLPSQPANTYLCDATNLQRAVQNVRTRNVEVEMPLVGRAEDPSTVDWSYVQQAWWDAILAAYENQASSPMRMPLEMRIMGGSDVTMAPQRGNALGTCSIEILTLEKDSDKCGWTAFAQQVLDRWMSYVDADGAPLRTRPHWAKEWKGYKVGGRDWVERLRDDYSEELVEFRQTLAAIGREHGWTLQDIRQMFSNDFFDDFVFQGMDEAVVPSAEVVKAAPVQVAEVAKAMEAVA